MTIRRFATMLVLAGAAIPAFAQAPADNPSPMPPASIPPVSQSQADPNAAAPSGAVPPVASTMVPANPNVPPDPSAPVGSAPNPVVVGGNVTAPPATPQHYPLCTRTIKDECRNPGEARRG